MPTAAPKQKGRPRTATASRTCINLAQDLDHRVALYLLRPATNLYFDQLRLSLSLLRQRDRQHTSIRRSQHAIRIHRLGHRKVPAKAAKPPFNAMVVLSLLTCLKLPLTLDRQDLLLQPDIQIL